MKITKTRVAQANMAEIAVVFFMVIGAIVAIQVFVQRALQSRIRDANIYALRMAATAQGVDINAQYEPYYGNVSTIAAREQGTTVRLLPASGSTTGIYRKTINEENEYFTNSFQAPPKDAN